MIDNTPLYRPGLAAIAAVLALSSTPVLAQVALPADPAPAAPVAAPAAPVAAQAAPVQTVQAVPATPQLPDIAVPETSRAVVRSEAPARNVAAAKAAPARTAAVAPRVASPAPVAERTSAPAAAATAPAAQSVAKPTVTPVRPIETAPLETARTTPAVQSASARSATEDGYAGWALLGGGLLLVAGGAAFALTRRPKRRDESDYVIADENLRTATPVPVVSAQPVVAAPVLRQPAHDPVPERVAAPVAASTPVEPRRAQPVSLDGDYAKLDPADRRAVLDAMVAEAPSEANPFHSRRNRLRRADFLLRTGRIEPRQGEYAVTEDRELETAGARDRWSEMRFQGSQKTRVSWKPASR